MKISFNVYAVLNGQGVVVSAWADEYHAKFEADRWSYDLKEDWTYVPATLVLEEGDDEATGPVATQIAQD